MLFAICLLQIATILVILQISLVATYPFYRFREGFDPFDAKKKYMMKRMITTPELIIYYTQYPYTSGTTPGLFVPILTGIAGKKWYNNEYTNIGDNPKISVQLSGIFESN